MKPSPPEFQMTEFEARELIAKLTPPGFVTFLRTRYKVPLKLIAKAMGVTSWMVIRYQSGRSPMPDERLDNLLIKITAQG